MIEQALLDELWDFDDPAASAERFRAALVAEPALDPVARQELTTQLARALGLQQQFVEARALLDALDGADVEVVIVRVALERGRVENSSGDPAQAIPHFERAARVADGAGLEFLLIDALHMLAIVDPPRARDWTRQGIDLAARSTDPRTQRWLIALHSNWGWSLYDVGDFREARQHMDQAAAWADRVGTQQQRGFAREAVEECARAAAAGEQASG